MRKLLAVLALALVTAHAAAAQSTSWLQIEARPTEGEARDRAADYAARLADVNGFALASGWFAIALGPYSEAEAASLLARLRGSGAIPADSFVSDGQSYGDRFFGAGDAAAIPDLPAEPLPPLQPGEETEAEARAAERTLSREERALVQVALRWEGVYTAAIDADFGPGTRRAMAAWQEAQRYEPTGVLTSRQRRELVGAYLEARASLDMSVIRDDTAGIEIAVPAGLVAFDRYEPPFAHYAPATEDGVRMILISQTGDRDTLGALYEVMQTLEIVPLSGSRTLRRDDFSITGENDRIVSYTYARLSGGEIKGFSLVWPAGDDKRRRLALEEIAASFRTTGGVLPETMGSGRQDIDLLAGLEIRRPDRARSGFYVDGGGAVLTTLAGVAGCSRITIGEEVEADVAAEETGLGLALLRPREAQVPIAVAKLAEAEPRLLSDVAVAGFSFGGVLDAPSVTYGTLADVAGLDGDTRLARLDVAAEPGDAGGPVFDATGAVVGMLLDHDSGTRRLPEGVAFAADAPVLTEFLAAHGIVPARAGPDGVDIAPEDLGLMAADMTVVVNCWN